MDTLTVDEVTLMDILCDYYMPSGTDAIAKRADDYAGRAKQCADEAVRYAVLAGLELIRLKALLPSGSFSGFLRSGRLISCGCSTAYKYMQLAEHVFPADQLAVLTGARADTDSETLIPPNSLTRLTCDAGKSLTQLYRDYGIIGRGRAGGSRPGAGRKPASLSEDEIAAAKSGCINGALAALYQAAEGFSPAALRVLPDRDLTFLRDALRDALNVANAVCTERFGADSAATDRSLIP